MKANVTKALLGILLIAVLATCVTGCRIRGHVDWPVIWVDEGHHGVSHEYYYYPDSEVYFDPGLHFWYWREGGEWRHGDRVPRDMRLGRREGFRSDADRPYALHDRVTERFHGGAERREAPRAGAPERRGDEAGRGR